MRPIPGSPVISQRPVANLNLSGKHGWQREALWREGGLQGDAAGTACMAVGHYFAGRLQAEPYRLKVPPARQVPASCRWQGKVGTNVAGVRLRERGEGSIRRKIGGDQHGLAEEAVMTQVDQQQQQNQLDRPFHLGLRPSQGLPFILANSTHNLNIMSRNI